MMVLDKLRAIKKGVADYFSPDTKNQDFDLLAALGSDGNLQLNTKVFQYWVHGEDAVQNEVVIISTVGDKESGKSTTMDNIQDQLEELAGTKPKNAKKDKSYYFPRSYPGTKDESLMEQNGILLRNKPYKIFNGTRTVAVYLIEIWTSSKNRIDAEAYTKLVDFCLSVSTIVVWTKKETQSSWLSVSYDKHASIVQHVPEQLFPRIIFCYYNWPYENVKVLCQYGKIGRTEFVNKFSDPKNLPVTTKIVTHAVEVGKVYQDAVYFCCPSKDAGDKQQSLFSKDGITLVLKQSYLKPVYGPNSNRIAENIKELVVQVVHVLYDPASLKESSSFNLRKSKSIARGTGAGGQKVEIVQSKVNRPAESAVKNYVTETYFSAFAKCMVKSENHLLFSEEIFTEYHYSATEAALDSFAKQWPAAVDEKMCDVVEKQIVLIVGEILETKSEIEALLQEAETEIASCILRMAPNVDVGKCLDTNLRSLDRKIVGFKHPKLKEIAKEYCLFKLGMLYRASEYVCKYDSYMRQPVMKNICLKPDELCSHRKRSCDLSAEEPGFSSRSNASLSLKSYVESVIDRLYGLLEKENDSIINQETMLAKNAYVVALNLYHRGMEAALAKSVFSLADLHKLHENMSSFIVDAYGNMKDFEYSFVWTAAKENLRMQLQNELPTYQEKNLANLNRFEIRRKEIVKHAFSIFEKRMIIDSLEKSASKRKLNYLEARQLALDYFQDQVLNHPGELVKYWKVNLADAMERYKADTNSGSNENVVQQVPKRLPPVQKFRASASAMISIDDNDLQLGLLYSESQEMKFSPAALNGPSLFQLIEGRLVLADATETLENMLASSFTAIKDNLEKSWNANVDFWMIVVSASMSCGGKRRLKNGLLLAGMSRHKIVYRTTAIVMSYHLGHCSVPKSPGRHCILAVHQSVSTIEIAFCDLDKTHICVRKIFSVENQSMELEKLIVSLITSPKFCPEVPTKILICGAQPELYSGDQLLQSIKDSVDAELSGHVISEFQGVWSGSLGLCENLRKNTAISCFEASPYEIVIQYSQQEIEVVRANELLNKNIELSISFPKTEGPALSQIRGEISEEIATILPSKTNDVGYSTRSRSMLTLIVSVDEEGIIEVRLRNYQNQSVAYACPNKLTLFDLKPPATMEQKNSVPTVQTSANLQPSKPSEQVSIESTHNEIQVDPEARMPASTSKHENYISSSSGNALEDENPLKKELKEKIVRIKVKLEVSQTPGPVKNHIKKRIDAASLLLQEADVPDAKLRQAIDGLNASEEAIKN